MKLGLSSKSEQFLLALQSFSCLIDVMTTGLQSHTYSYFFPLTQWYLHCLRNVPELSQEHTYMISLLQILQCCTGTLGNLLTVRYRGKYELGSGYALGV